MHNTKYVKYMLISIKFISQFNFFNSLRTALFLNNVITAILHKQIRITYLNKYNGLNLVTGFLKKII